MHRLKSIEMIIHFYALIFTVLFGKSIVNRNPINKFGLNNVKEFDYL